MHHTAPPSIKAIDKPAVDNPLFQEERHAHQRHHHGKRSDPTSSIVARNSRICRAIGAGPRRYLRVSQNEGRKEGCSHQHIPKYLLVFGDFFSSKRSFLPPSGVLRAALRECLVGSTVSFAGVMRVFCHCTLRYPLAFQYVSRCVFLGRETLARLLACEDAQHARLARDRLLRRFGISNTCGFGGYDSTVRSDIQVEMMLFDQCCVQWFV